MHQTSSASMAGIMAAFWPGYLRNHPKVVGKPDAAPVYHAIKCLTGELDQSYFTRLRGQDGRQDYPSRTEDPNVSDSSTDWCWSTSATTTSRRKTGADPAWREAHRATSGLVCLTTGIDEHKGLCLNIGTTNPETCHLTEGGDDRC